MTAADPFYFIIEFPWYLVDSYNILMYRNFNFTRYNYIRVRTIYFFAMFILSLCCLFVGLDVSLLFSKLLKGIRGPREKPEGLLLNLPRLEEHLITNQP